MDKANIKGDIWHMFIGDDDSPFMASVSLKDMLELEKVFAMQTGTTPIRHMINGTPIKIDLSVQEWEIAGIKRALGITAANPTDGKYSLPTIGTAMPTHAVRLHDPNAADTSLDYVFPQMVFDGLVRTADGKGNAAYTTTLHAEVGPNGFACEIGYVAQP